MAQKKKAQLVASLGISETRQDKNGNFNIKVGSKSNAIEDDTGVLPATYYGTVQLGFSRQETQRFRHFLICGKCHKQFLGLAKPK